MPCTATVQHKLKHSDNAILGRLGLWPAAYAWDWWSHLASLSLPRATAPLHLHTSFSVAIVLASTYISLPCCHCLLFLPSRRLPTATCVCTYRYLHTCLSSVPHLVCAFSYLCPSCHSTYYRLLLLPCTLPAQTHLTAPPAYFSHSGEGGHKQNGNNCCLRFRWVLYGWPSRATVTPPAFASTFCHFITASRILGPVRTCLARHITLLVAFTARLQHLRSAAYLLTCPTWEACYFTTHSCLPSPS